MDLTEWNFPSSSQAVVGAGGRWSLGDFERTELRKESERKGGEGVQRRARGREARSGARRRRGDMRRYGAGPRGSTTTTVTTEDSPESLREVGTPR